MINICPIKTFPVAISSQIWGLATLQAANIIDTHYNSGIDALELLTSKIRSK